MSRLTITRSEARYPLKEASAQRARTIGQLMDESLDFYGVESRQDALDLVRRARSLSKLTEGPGGRSGAGTGSGGAPQTLTGAAAIIDSNVVVAGVLTSHEATPVAPGMLAAGFPFVRVPGLLAEYRAVLVRPILRKFHRLTVAEVKAILTDIAQHAIVLAPVVARPAPDPGHQFL